MSSHFTHCYSNYVQQLLASACQQRFDDGNIVNLNVVCYHNYKEMKRWV